MNNNPNNLPEYRFADFPNIMKLAKQMAEEKNHPTVKTQHIFLAVGKYLHSMSVNAQDYAELYEKFKEVLGKYSVKSKEFRELFEKQTPASADPTVAVELEEETAKFYAIVKAIEKSENRPIEIADVIVALFSDKAYDLYLTLDALLGDEHKVDDLYDDMLRTFKSIKKISSIAELDQLIEVRNLNKKVIEDDVQPMIGCDEGIKKILMGLSCKTVKSVVLTGQAGTGKTALVKELARRIVNGDVPDEFKDKKIYSWDITSTNAGTKFRGIF